MNKAAAYLNQHLNGEALISKAATQRYSYDASMLKSEPEIVVMPRTLDDVRKVMRFAWQLAEKGHSLPVTVRGIASDTTGGALASEGGVSVDSAVHLNKLLETDLKKRLVRVQPGCTILQLNNYLDQHGLTWPVAGAGTIGGAIAGNKFSYSNDASSYVERLEVVLSSGEVLETGRISRREVEHKKGLTTFEGEIYRTIDSLCDDYADVITTISNRQLPSGAGYEGIINVRDGKGAIDLTPLFVGSQGTLGVISEAIVQVSMNEQSSLTVFLRYPTVAAARDSVDELLNLKPNNLSLRTGNMFTQTVDTGRIPEWLNEIDEHGALVEIKWSDIAPRQAKRLVKKLQKKLVESSVEMTVVGSGDDQRDVQRIRSTAAILRHGFNDGRVVPAFFSNMAISTLVSDKFCKQLAAVEAKHEIVLPYRLDMISGELHFYPRFDATKVGGRQAMMKTFADVAELVCACGGTVVASGGEGRIKSGEVYARMDTKELALYEAIQTLFDPHRVLNVAAKRPVEANKVARSLDGHFYSGTIY